MRCMDCRNYIHCKKEWKRGDSLNISCGEYLDFMTNEEWLKTLPSEMRWSVVIRNLWSDLYFKNEDAKLAAFMRWLRAPHRPIVRIWWDAPKEGLVQVLFQGEVFAVYLEPFFKKFLGCWEIMNDKEGKDEDRSKKGT